MSEQTVSLGDANITPSEGLSVSVAPGDPFEVSACCHATIETRVQKTHPEHDWFHTYFVCDDCGQPAAKQPNPVIVAREKQIREQQQEIARLRGAQVSEATEPRS